MLTINRSEDIDKMMEYHRTRDMLNLIKYFPDISPIIDLTIVEDLDDYYRNYEYLKNLTSSRNDTIITKPMMKSVEVKSVNPSVVDIFPKVKEIDPDGVVVLFNLLNTSSERYDRYAGISVGVSLDNGIYIDAVGQGFDGREVSKGICTHERYFIPWFEIRRCNIGNFKEYRTYLISQDEYKKSREERIKFLISIGIDENIALEKVPEEYKEIPDYIWLDVIKNLIKEVYQRELELKSDGLTEFAISGHTEGIRFRPWQIFDKKRYELTRKR